MGRWTITAPASGATRGPAIRATLPGGRRGSAATADPQLERSGTEGEVLPDASLQVAQVGGREGAGGEEREGGRVDRPLGRVEHPGAGCGVGRLGQLDDTVQL